MNEQEYWTDRYQKNNTGWDIGYPATPLKEYIDQLTDKNIHILIPGAGNGYEAEYLYKQGFINTYVLDISKLPLEAFSNRVPEFPKSQLLQGDFFTHKGNYDLILEQTFFCSFVPTDENRSNYVSQIDNLLKPKGKLVGLWFDIPLTSNMEKRPFGGDRNSYLLFLKKHLEMITFDKCYNSIPTRAGSEFFGIFQKL